MGHYPSYVWCIARESLIGLPVGIRRRPSFHAGLGYIRVKNHELIDSRSGGKNFPSPSLNQTVHCQYLSLSHQIKSHERELVEHPQAGSEDDEGVHLWPQRSRFQSLVQLLPSQARPILRVLQYLA